MSWNYSISSENKLTRKTSFDGMQSHRLSNQHSDRVQRKFKQVPLPSQEGGSFLMPYVLDSQLQDVLLKMFH